HQQHDQHHEHERDEDLDAHVPTDGRGAAAGSPGCSRADVEVAAGRLRARRRTSTASCASRTTAPTGITARAGQTGTRTSPKRNSLRVNERDASWAVATTIQATRAMATASPTSRSQRASCGGTRAVTSSTL